MGRTIAAARKTSTIAVSQRQGPAIARLRGGAAAGEASEGRSERRREAVLKLNREALEGLRGEELIDRALELAVTELRLERCELWEFEPAGHELKLRACTGPAAGRARSPISATPSLQPGFAFRASKPVTTDDFRDEVRFTPHPGVDPERLRSGIAVRVPGAFPGYGVVVGYGERPRPYQLHDQRFLEALGHLLGSAIDRTRYRERLLDAERRYRNLIERLPVVTYVAEYGPTGRWLFVSPQIEEMLGYTVREWRDDPLLWFSRIHPDDREMVAEEEERCAAGERPLAIEYRIFARDGRLVWIRDDASIGAPGADGAVVVEGLLTDITTAKHAEQELRRRAERDDLTGLYNRRHFEEALARHRASDDRGAVALLDVDSLKFVNDALGHAAGDALLRGVAHALEAERRDDEVLARFGGDEFALLLPGAGEDEARARVQRCVGAVRNRASQFPASASAGLVTFEGDGTATDADLLVAADIALHDAKERGGDRVATFSGSEGERLAWLGRVRAAIDNDGLLLHAQPILDLATGEVVAQELLVRMVGADGEVLLPGAFLPTAERFGLIREIDAWVTERAVDLAAAGATVTVNLSARSIADLGLTEVLSERLEATGAPPERLVFEITETGAVTAIEDLRAFGSRIERLGCSLAIDDFGTGFGSLTYLKHLPVRLLKIDTEFVRGITGSQSDQGIVRAIVTIARSLGMRTVAEGVEDAAAAELVRELGVDLAQGFHFGRPCPLAAAA